MRNIAYQSTNNFLKFLNDRVQKKTQGSYRRNEQREDRNLMEKIEDKITSEIKNINPNTGLAL
jgi:hypothetical protein